MSLDVFLSNISSAQVKTLSTATISKLATEESVAALGKNGAHLSAGQVGAIDKSVIEHFDFSNLSSKSAAGLTVDQIGALEGEKISALTTEAMKGLSSAAVGALVKEQLAELIKDPDDAGPGVALLEALNAKQIASLKVAELEGDTLTALTAAQVKGLTTAQMSALDGTQLAAIDDDLGALTSVQLKALDTDVIKGLGNDGLAALDTAALTGLEAEDFMALSDEQLGALFLFVDGEDPSADSLKRLQSVNAEWVTAAYLDLTSEA